jgi:hypothetical protein
VNVAVGSSRQEISHHLKPEVSFPCTQQPATGTFLNQTNQVHNLKTYLSKTHFNIILSCRATFPKLARHFRSSGHHCNV